MKTTIRTSKSTTGKFTREQQLNNAQKVVDNNKRKIIAIASSTIGSALLLAIIIIAIVKFKNKTQSPQKLTEIATPSVDHKKYDARTFVNASFDGN